MKRMLFNATHAEELRVAIVDGQKLVDFDLESAIRTEKKGNIYKGIITKVEPSLEACFVDYGAEKNGFLPLREIYRNYFNRHSSDYDPKTPISQVKIDSVIEEGQEMIVQVDKDERGNKGAALTTFVSLAGRFLVFMPNNPKGGGISRRVAGDERAELKTILSNLNIDAQHSLIARTEGIGRSQNELQWDLDFLTTLWQTIEQSASGVKAPFLIYQESNLVIRAIRDHLSEYITEIIIDDEEIYERAKRFIERVMPQSLSKLKLYKDSVPLFSRYQIERQIESAFNREVHLPSGGAIVIDHTEALISIDVNSARATKGSDIEETALQTNLEAVGEIARQLRVRDMGGLIVIDLIDMMVSRNQRDVETQLRNAVQADRARIQIGQISRFGLLEMSRQRLRSSISEANYQPCPRCEGMGSIRNIVSSSLNLLRIIEDEALKENAEAIQVVLPLDMATYLLNEKRDEFSQLESKLASKIIIIPSSQLSSPHFQVKRLRSEEFDTLSGIASYKQKVEIDNHEANLLAKPATNQQVALVKLDEITHRPPPERKLAKAATIDNKKSSLLRRIGAAIFGENDADEPQHEQNREPAQARRKPHNRPNNQSAYGRGRGNQQNRKRQQNDKPSSDQQVRQHAHSERDDKPNHAGRTQQDKPNPRSRHMRSRKRNPNHDNRPAQATPQHQETEASSQNLSNNEHSVRPPRQSNQTPRPNRQRQSNVPHTPSSGHSQNHRTNSQNINSQQSRPIPTADENIPDDIGNRKF